MLSKPIAADLRWINTTALNTAATLNQNAARQTKPLPKRSEARLGISGSRIQTTHTGDNQKMTAKQATNPIEAPQAQRCRRSRRVVASAIKSAAAGVAGNQ
jgi:phage protein D